MNQRNPDDVKREIATFFHFFQKECRNLTQNVDKQLQQSVQQQRKELANIAQESVRKGLGEAINRYNERLHESESSLSFRIQQLERTLDELNRKNQKLVIRSWLATSIALGTLVIGAAYLLYHYKSEIEANKASAELTKLINQSDLTICGNKLCAAVSGPKTGKYRVVNPR